MCEACSGLRFSVVRIGIWMCRGQGMNVMVMDVEGTDGRERGEDQVCVWSSPAQHSFPRTHDHIRT